MFLQIYNENKIGNTVVRLRLIEAVGGITLAAVDDTGEVVYKGYLLTICPKSGALVLHHGINKTLGFVLDKNTGQLKVKGE